MPTRTPIFDIPYLISNENLRRTVATTPNARRVLTICGSGDQALFYTLGGATTVDTFDININARTIQDIKTAAIKVLPYEKYMPFLQDLYCHAAPIPAQILTNLPTHSATEAPHLHFRNNIGESDKNKLPTAAEYARLQATLHQQFNFINADLAEIHTRTDSKYDVINISNIFDINYISDIKQQIQILQNLTPLLNINGTIVYNNQAGYTYAENATLSCQNGMTLRHRSIMLNSINRLNLFQRIR